MYDDTESGGGSQFGGSGRNRKLEIAYDGTDYRGFQIQKDQPTIQGVIEDALGRVLGERVRLHGASRTDTGVHARGQVANFRSARPMPCDRLQQALNAVMPPEIRIMRAGEADDAFHARYSALSKTYRYRMYAGRTVPPFEHRYVHHVSWLTPAAVDAMDRAARSLVGMTDMACFMSAGSPVRDTRRDVLAARVVASGPEVHFVIEATGFLRRSVRTMVGTLLLVGRGKLDAAELSRIIEAGRREAAGPPAPAKGLTLERVTYPAREAGP